MSKTSIVKRGIPCFLAIILIISMGMSLLNGFYTVQASLPDIDSGRTNIDTPQADCGGTQQNTPLLPENDNNNLDDPQVDQATPQHDVWPPEEDDDNEPREYDRYDDGDDNRDYPLPPHPPWPPSPPPGNGSPYINKKVRNPACGNWQDDINADVGDTVTFKITITPGTRASNMRNIQVKDWLPSGISFVSSDPQPTDIQSFNGTPPHYPPFPPRPPRPPLPPKWPPYWPPNSYSVLSWNLAGVTLNKGESTTITVTGKIQGCCCCCCEDLKNIAEVDAKATTYANGCNNPRPNTDIDGSDSAYVNVDCEPPNINIQKKVKTEACGNWVEHTTVGLGDTVEFRIALTNTADYALNNVLLRDQLPLELDYVSANPTPDSVQFSLISWRFDMAAQETKYFYVTAEANAVTELATNNAYVDYNCCIHKNDTATVTIVDEGNPDFTIDKKVKENCCGTYQNSITVDPEQWVTFKITVTNTGDVPLDITIQDQLPTEFTYNNNAEVNGIPTEPTINNNIYTWELTNIALQETTIITFQATPNECGTHTNTATATTTYQSQTITKQDTANVTVHCDPDPDLSIEKKVSLDGTSWLDHVSAEVDSLVSFRINVTNTGNIDLLNVTVFDDFNNSVLAYVEDSANYEPSSVTDHLIKWRHVDLAVGESRVIRFDATIVGAGTGINNASGVILAEETGGSIIMVYDMVTVTGTMPGILDVDKTVWDDGVWSEETEADIGDTVRFNISITNNGPGPYGLYDMYVNDTLPGILVYNDTVKGPDPVTISGDNRNISWLLFDQGMLEPGETFSLEFTADVVAEGRQYNVVNVSSEYCDPDPSLYYDEDTAAVDAHGGETSVAVNKLVRNQSSDWQNEVTAGYLDVVRFNITVTNTGSTLLTTINVNDTLPEALGYLGNATVNGETRDPNVITSSVIMWELTDGLSSGEQLFIEFDAEVNQNEGDQTVENQVIVVAENESTGQVTPDVSDAALVQLIEQNDSVAPTSSVEAISPDIQSAPIGVTATATDDESGVHNVTLYYCHSHNQIAPWGEWMKYDTDSVDADGWSWSFDAPNGTGYYRFYSRAADNAGNIEESKDDFEASVRVVAENIEVSIEKPKGCCFYVNDNEVCKTLFGKTRIVGPITVEAVTNDVVTLVEFYVDDELVGTDENAPFAYTIDDRLIGKHVIKVVAHGSNENSAEAEVTAHIFNLGGSSDSEEGSSQALNTHRGSQSAVSSDSEAKAISTHTVVSNGKANKAVVCKNTNRNINNKLFISNRI